MQGKHAAELTHEVELGTPNLDHVEKFAEELEAAGIHTDRYLRFFFRRMRAEREAYRMRKGLSQ